MPILVIAGVALVVVAAVLWWLRGRQRAKARRLRGRSPTALADLRRICDEVRLTAGAGQYAEQIEATGAITCAGPLRAELTGTPCVWYRFSVEREYETRETRRDRNGREETHTVRHTATLASDERHTAFQLRDGAETITIHPEGADVHLRETLDQRLGEGVTPPAAGHLAAMVARGAARPGERVLGYRWKEEVLPLDAALYIAAEAADLGSEVVLRRPKEGEFILSLKSEAEVLKGIESAATWLGRGAGVALVAGLAAAVVGVLV